MERTLSLITCIMALGHNAAFPRIVPVGTITSFEPGTSWLEGALLSQLCYLRHCKWRHRASILTWIKVWMLHVFDMWGTIRGNMVSVMPHFHQYWKWYTNVWLIVLWFVQSVSAIEWSDILDIMIQIPESKDSDTTHMISLVVIRWL